MKSIKLCYTNRNNLGDSINPYIVERVLGYKVELANPFDCDMTGIGSGLRRFIVTRKILMSPKFYFLKFQLVRKKYIIWSAGFTYWPNQKEFFIRRNFIISSVRGELTKKRLELILGRPLNITTGDAGLLASELIKYGHEKKYRLGIIPHVSERNEKKFIDIKNSIANSIMIDVRDNPLLVVELISKCECVISSSLHGLVISDSFNIPNRQVTLTQKLSGDGYKFDDYYSVFGLTPNPIDLTKGQNISIDDIINNYKITKDMVEKKKVEIKKAFYAFLPKL